MKYRDEIIKIIKEKENYSKYSIGINNDKIDEIEQTLNIKLPEDYKWFLKNYGQILIMGVEIYGVLENKILSCVKITEDYRKLGLPNKFVVIENCDEWVYCIDTSNIEDGECYVVDWDRIDGVGFEEYENFLEFFYKRLVTAMENWD
ncbi:MAG: SMI1/KNR4 family protein [Clostridium sp.]|nr:SMI1/KNR4 family protein [Clostridium sp.]